MIKDYKDLIIWQKAHQLVVKIYKVTEKWPTEERFSLTGDTRRAARSIPTNIVEGFGRRYYKDGMRFFNISDASLAELKYHTLLAFDLSYTSKEEYEELVNLENELGRVLNGWQKSYKKNKKKVDSPDQPSN